MDRHMSWKELCCSDLYRGLWVALDNCRYDAKTKKPLAGVVVDADEELAELARRMRQNGRCSCAILFCDEDPLATPAATPAARIA